MSIVYLIYFGYADPHEERAGERLEHMNEVILTLVTYHVFLFCNIILDGVAVFNVGYSYIVFTCLLLLFNIIYMMYVTITKACLKHRRWKNKKLHMQELKEKQLGATREKYLEQKASRGPREELNKD